MRMRSRFRKHHRGGHAVADRRGCDHPLWLLCGRDAGVRRDRPRITSIWNVVPKTIDAAPCVPDCIGEFAGKTPTGSVVTSSQFGRIEMLQYGELNNCDSDLAVVMMMPPNVFRRNTRAGPERPRSGAVKRPRIMSKTHYDLETRFGEFRATEMRVDPTAAGSNAVVRSRFETDCGDHRLVLRRQRQQAKSERAGLHPRQDRARARACLEGRGQFPPRADGETGALQRRAGDANYRHRPPRRAPPSRWSQPSATPTLRHQRP